MRIRSIKPEFWRSEDIAGLPWDDRLIFIGLWSYVDDNGVGRDVAKLITADLMPLEQESSRALARITGALASLSEAFLITRYTVESRPFLRIATWDRHQRIDKPTKGRYPLPDDPRAVLTCNDHAESVSFARTSGVLASPPVILAPGAVEQRNRGTEEKVKNTPPTASRVATPMTLTAAAVAAGFDAFWQTYPRRIGKKAARLAFQRATASVLPVTLIDAAARFRDDPTRDQAFTPHPATWLNQGRWDDEGPARPAEQNSAEKRQAHNLALIERFAEPQQPPAIEPARPDWLASAPGWGTR